MKTSTTTIDTDALSMTALITVLPESPKNTTTISDTILGRAITVKILPSGLVGQQIPDDTLPVKTIMRFNAPVIYSVDLKTPGSRFCRVSKTLGVIIEVSDIQLEQEISDKYKHQDEAIAVLRALFANKLCLPVGFNDPSEISGLYTDIDYLVNLRRTTPSAFKRGTEDRCIITLPTGTGKTRIFLTALYEYSQNIQNGVIIITAPSIALTRQLEKEFKKFVENQQNYNSEEWLYSVVSSDKDLKINEEDRELVKYLERCPLRTTEKIGEWLTSSKPKKVIFATDKSTGKITEALESSNIKADVVVVDEAHRVQDAGACSILTGMPSKFMLFFTATPKEKISNTNEEHEFGMHLKDFYGHILYSKTPKEMIDVGTILDFKTIVLQMDAVTKNEILEVIGDDMADRGIDKVEEFIAVIVGLLESFDSGYSKSIAYCRSINHINDYINNFDLVKKVLVLSGFEEAEDMYVGSLTGKIVGKDRLQILKDFDESYNGILFNISVIREGIDVPDCNTVFWLRQMNSINLVQTAGRCVRTLPVDGNPGKTKTAGMVMIPMTASHERDGKRTCSKSFVFEAMMKLLHVFKEAGYHDSTVGIPEEWLQHAHDGDGEKVKREFRPDTIDMTAEEIKQALDNGNMVPVNYLPENNIIEEVEKTTARNFM
jgi:superfamily II DNA or RNA helicase